MPTLHQTLTGPVAADLAAIGIHLVVSGDTRTTCDAWSDATDIVRANAPGNRLALIHLSDGSWDGGVPRYLEHGKGWFDATLIKVSYPHTVPGIATDIVGVLTRNGFDATWDGDTESGVHINLRPADLLQRTPIHLSTADRLRVSHEYAETHVTHGHDVMLEAAAELDRVTADADVLRRSLNDLEGRVIVDAAQRANDLAKARLDGERDALRDLHEHLRQVMRDGGTVTSLAEEIERWFVKKGLGTVIYV